MGNRVGGEAMSDVDRQQMSAALALALQGEGHVEPNPMVGCILTQGSQVVGRGWHGKFGGPHAEIVALADAADRARGATAYVTLEPCCHQGKTPPCTEALIRAGVRRVVIALGDPFPQVAGQGVAELQAAGISVEVGLLEAPARDLCAPYLKLLEQQHPWIIAKWAMTLDGRIATASGDSRWISGEASRAVVHQIRGRVDGILIGRNTAHRDDPVLTARPPGSRTAVRIVIDSAASLSPSSQLAATSGDSPVLVAVSNRAPAQRCDALSNAGCEVLRLEGSSRQQRLLALLDELGRRRMTNLLVEGGGKLLGSLLDAGQLDEVHAFIAPKLIGAADALSPLAACGAATIDRAWRLSDLKIETLDGDVYVRGRVAR